MSKKEDENLPLNSIINENLLNSLPGIFYVYEIIDGTAYLKKWNDNHVTVSGYTPEELLNKKVLTFIDKPTRPYIIEGINTLVKNGSVKNVYGNMVSKTGEVTPYVFEGYRINIGERLFFMGMGLNIADLVNAKEQIKLLEFQKLKKEKELFSVALREQNKEELLQRVLLKLESVERNLKNKSNAKAIQSLTSEIKSHFSFSDNWHVFKRLFGEIHYDFFAALTKKHTNLTKGELQYCAYIKIHMPSTNICNVMNISKEGLIKKRYRLKKKLGLDKNKNLDRYIHSI